MGSGGPGRQAGRAPEGEREGFFLKNPDAKEMNEASSQEGKCLAYVVNCGNQDLDWVGGGCGATSASNFRRQGLL